MNSITESDIKPQWIEQNFLKQNNPHIFLQILHYILIKFSPSFLFVKVLDFYPTIKDDNDKKFITNTLTLARKMLDIDVKIDIDQFLSSKFVEKKTEFTSSFSKSAYEFYLKQTKQNFMSKNLSNQNKKDNELSSQVPVKIPNKQLVDDDSDDEAPRNLNLTPSNTKRPLINKNCVKSSSEDEDMKEFLKIKNQKKSKDKNRATKQPINKFLQIDQNKRERGFQGIERFELEQTESNQMKQNRTEIQKTLQKYQHSQGSKSPNLQPKILKSNGKNIGFPPQQIAQPNQNDLQFDPSQYVTREEFMEIMSGMSKNLTELLTKFNDFQSQVSGWVQNVNAKISILQQNVKTIKNNL